MTRYWCNTISLEHVQGGVAGGFTQADHGGPTRLARLERGDGLVFYSPRTAIRSGEPVQQFTALGTIADDENYRVEVSADFHPWRRRVDFAETRPADVRPLLDDLTFVTDKQRWGLPFRRGLFEIPAADFERVAGAMGVPPDEVARRR